MSIMMDDITLNFIQNKELIEKYDIDNKYYFIPYIISKDEIYIFKIKIIDIVNTMNAYTGYINPAPYISFSIISKEKKQIEEVFTSIKTIIEFPFFLTSTKIWKLLKLPNKKITKITEIKEKEIETDNEITTKVKNRFYSEDSFYSCFDPMGFVPKDFLFSEKVENCIKRINEIKNDTNNEIFKELKRKSDFLEYKYLKNYSVKL
jgi:hypothetical protein